MKEEIKEILDKLQKVANRETASRNALMEMKDKDYQLLLDYITNLQEENERQSKAQVILDNQIAEMWKYKQRNEKVIQYIDSLFNVIDYKDEEFITFETLQNIQDLAKYGQLKGDKDE